MPDANKNPTAVDDMLGVCVLLTPSCQTFCDPMKL